MSAKDIAERLAKIAAHTLELVTEHPEVASAIVLLVQTIIGGVTKPQQKP